MAKKLKSEVGPNEEMKSNNKSAKVFSSKGMFVREYSLEVHGEKFLDYAKEFAKKNGHLVQ